MRLRAVRQEWSIHCTPRLATPSSDVPGAIYGQPPPGVDDLRQGNRLFSGQAALPFFWTFSQVRDWRRRHRGSGGERQDNEALFYEGVSHAYPPPPVRAFMGAPRSSGEHALRCLRVLIRTKAGHFSCGSGWVNQASAPFCSSLIAARPFGHWNCSLASVEGGQYETPVRPAAGVSSTRAPRHRRRSTGRTGEDEVIAKRPVSPTDGLRRNPRLPRPSSGAGATADVPAHPF